MRCGVGRRAGDVWEGDAGGLINDDGCPSRVINCKNVKPKATQNSLWKVRRKTASAIEMSAI